MKSKRVQVSMARCATSSKVSPAETTALLPSWPGTNPPRARGMHRSHLLRPWVARWFPQPAFLGASASSSQDAAATSLAANTALAVIAGPFDAAPNAAHSGPRDRRHNNQPAELSASRSGSGSTCTGAGAGGGGGVTANTTINPRSQARRETETATEAEGRPRDGDGDRGRGAGAGAARREDRLRAERERERKYSAAGAGGGGQVATANTTINPRR